MTAFSLPDRVCVGVAALVLLLALFSASTNGQNSSMLHSSITIIVGCKVCVCRVQWILVGWMESMQRDVRLWHAKSLRTVGEMPAVPTVQTHIYQADCQVLQREVVQRTRLASRFATLP